MASSRERRLLLLAMVLLAVVGLLVRARYPGPPTYDSLTAFSWGRDVWDGRLPAFDAFRAPTEHPLLLLFAIVTAPFGTAAPTLWVGTCIVGLAALVGAMYRLGRVAAGVLGGLAAAALVATRLNFALLTTLGFLDIPYCALVAWAAALEVERPRRGGAVWVLLILAGLLRPEAWVLLGLYGLWLASTERGVVPRLRALAPAAIAPGFWALTDLVVTGNPLFSLTYTDASAAELQRERPVGELPGLTLRLLEEVLKGPVLLLAVLGLLLAAVLRRRDLALPALLVPVTIATYGLIALNGLPGVYRYLLVAGLGLSVFAAFAFAGWTTLPPEHPWRRPWSVGAGLLLLGGVAFTATHTSPKKVTSELRERVATSDDLEALVRMPAVRRGLRCGALSVPTQKLVPELRYLLDAPEGFVFARADPDRPAPTRGVAIVIDRRFENRPALNIREVPRDRLRKVNDPPEGFALVGGNRHFAAYVAC